jgi:S-adenosylmethionine hydrolase
VHVVVVDPGVGTRRRPIVTESDGRFGVGPDNGVLTPMLGPGARIFEINRPGLRLEPVSATFHGRDLFAPAAAYLAGGGSAERAGPPVRDPVLLPELRPARDDAGVSGVVVHVDRFGTLVTNVPAEWVASAVALGGTASVELGGRPAGPVRRTYGDVASGDVVALIGSGGTLEISVRDGSAAERLGGTRGTPVRVRIAG